MGNYKPRNEEEKALLERAKKEYPKGTRYFPIDLYGNRERGMQTVVREPVIYAQGDGEGIYIEGGMAYIYAYGQWAELVDKPPLVDNYLIFN